jgi:hypothetical protein
LSNGLALQKNAALVPAGSDSQRNQRVWAPSAVDKVQ